MKLSAWAKSRPYASMALSILTIALLAEGALWMRLRATRRDLKRHRARLTAMQDLAGQYRALRARAASLKASLPKGRSPLTGAAVDHLAREQRVDLKMSDTSATRVRHSEALEEQVVSFAMRGVTRKSLAHFLYAAEALGPGVRTKKLRITSHAKDPQLVDAQGQFSAYEAPSQPTE